MLVFVQSKERAKELFSELLYDGINVDVIHSDRTQLQVCSLMNVCFDDLCSWCVTGVSVCSREIML